MNTCNKFFLGLLLLTFCAPSSCAADSTTQADLLRKTQELFDAIAVGDKRPWDEYFAADAMYFDEKGRMMDKAALLKDVSPLPPGYSGKITIMRVQTHIEPNVAILSYDMDETETIFGQKLFARYHATDTWLRRHDKWQIVAGQVLRYYEDPSSGQVDPRELGDYIGTYQLAPGIEMTVSKEGEQLYAQRADRDKEILIPEAPDLFFRKGVEGRRLFHRGRDGKVDALIDRRNNEDVVWKKTK